MSTEMQTCPSCGELVPVEYVICVWCGYDLTAEHIRRSGIRIDRREATNRIYRVIVDPLKTFKEISLIPDTRGGKMVLYAIGFMMTLNMLIIFNKLQDLAFNNNDVRIIFYTFTNGRTISITLKFLINVAFLIVQPLALYFVFGIVWKIGSRIVRILARSVGGKGDKQKTRAILGYSLVPVLLAWTFNLLIRLISPRTEVAIPAGASNAEAFSSIQDALIQVAETGIGALTNVVLTIAWIWSLGLAAIGLRYSAKLSWIEAVLVAGIPFAIFMTIAL